MFAFDQSQSNSVRQSENKQYGYICNAYDYPNLMGKKKCTCTHTHKIKICVGNLGSFIVFLKT